MSHDSARPPEPPVPDESAPDSQFAREMDAALAAFAEAALAGKTDDVEVAAAKMMALAAAEELKNHSTFVRLANEAEERENQGDWAGGKAVRRQILAQAEASGNPTRISKANLDLCHLVRLLGRTAESAQFAAAAVAPVRDWQTNMFPLVWALSATAVCALDRGDSAAALTAATEALLAIKPEKLHDHLRARTLTLRARCLLAHDDPASAGLALASAWELLSVHPGASLPGIRWAFANWWEAKSDLEARLGDLPYAREAILQAIELRRQSHLQYARPALARALETFGKLSRMTGDTVGEACALAEARSIRGELHLPANV